MHILIVDDSKIMRQILKRALAKLGYPELIISEAANGLEALDSFRKDKFIH